MMCDILFLKYIVADVASPGSVYCLTRCCFINEFMIEFNFPYLLEDVSYICESNSHCKLGYDCHKIGIESMINYLNSKNTIFRVYCG